MGKKMQSDGANVSGRKRILAVKQKSISSEKAASSNIIRYYDLEVLDGCMKVQKGDEQSWNNLRELLNNFENNKTMLRETACSQGRKALDNGRTPLHILLEKKPPADIISTLIIYSPGATEIKNKCGELPIHIASRYGASIEVLSLLIQAYPEGLKVQSNHGSLPLHDLCFHGATYETVVLFLQSYPDSVKVKDVKDWLPIHRACWRNINLEVLNTLLEAYPQSPREKCSHGKPSTILNKYCRTLHLKDQYGRTLLHYAFNGHFSQDLIFLLTDAHPKGMEVTDMYGNTPSYYGNEQRFVPTEEILNSCFLERIYCDKSIMELSNTKEKASGEVALAPATAIDFQTLNLDQDTTTYVSTTSDSSMVTCSAGTALGSIAAVAQTTNGNQDTKNDNISLGSSKDYFTTSETEPVSPLISSLMEETFIESRNRHNKRLRCSLVKLRTTIDSNATSAIQMKEDMERQKSKIIFLESQARNLQSQLLELKTKNSELQSDNTHLTSQVGQLQTIHSELQSDNTYLKWQVVELQINNSELQSDNVTTKDEISRMKEEMNELKSDFEKFKDMLLSSLLQI